MCCVIFNILFFVFETAVVGMERRGKGQVMVVTEWEGERKGVNKFVLVRHSVHALPYCILQH